MSIHLSLLYQSQWFVSEDLYRLNKFFSTVFNFFNLFLLQSSIFSSTYGLNKVISYVQIISKGQDKDAVLCGFFKIITIVQSVNELLGSFL